MGLCASGVLRPGALFGCLSPFCPKVPQGGMSKFRRYFHAAKLQDVYACIRARIHTLSLYIDIYIFIFRSAHSITDLIWNFAESMSCSDGISLMSKLGVVPSCCPGGSLRSNYGIPNHGLLESHLLIPLKVLVYLYIRRQIDMYHTHTYVCKYKYKYRYKYKYKSVLHTYT